MEKPVVTTSEYLSAKGELRGLWSTLTSAQAQEFVSRLGSSESLPQLGYEKPVAVLLVRNNYPFDPYQTIWLAHDARGYWFYTGGNCEPGCCPDRKENQCKDE